jgi:hypothetical protein
MNISSKTYCAASLTFLISACGNGSSEPTLNHYQDEMSQSTDALQTSLDSHRKAVLAETDLGRIRAMEQDHMDAMGMDTNSMLGANDGIGLCSQHMNGDAVRSLRSAQGMMGETIDGMATETQRHFRAMHDADDVESALAEEQQHQSTMKQMLEGMHTYDQELESAMQEMQDDQMSMMCPSSSHMHHS